MNRRKLLQSVLAIGAVGVALKTIPKKAIPKKECADTALVRVQVYDGVDWQTRHIDYAKDAMHL